MLLLATLAHTSGSDRYLYDFKDAKKCHMQVSFRSRKRQRRWSSLFAACISGFSAFAEDDGNRNAVQINSDLKPRRGNHLPSKKPRHKMWVIERPARKIQIHVQGFVVKAQGRGIFAPGFQQGYLETNV